MATLRTADDGGWEVRPTPAPTGMQGMQDVIATPRRSSLADDGRRVGAQALLHIRLNACDDAGACVQGRQQDRNKTVR